MFDTIVIETAAKLGYTIDIKDGKIRYIYPTDRNGFNPEIFTPCTDFGENKGWTIQTTACGAQDADGIEQVIKGYQNAVKMVTYLEAWDYPTR